MAKLSRHEQDVAEQLLRKLYEHGAQLEAVEAALQQPAVLRSCAKQFATVTTVRGVTVTALTPLSQELPTRIRNWLKRNGVTTYGPLQCFSSGRILFRGGLGQGGIDAIEAHLGTCGLTLCGKRQEEAARIKEVFEDPKKAPLVAAVCLGILSPPDVKHFKKESLGDFAGMSRDEVARVMGYDRLSAFEEFLRALHISLKK